MISKTDGFLLTISMVAFLAEVGAGAVVISQYYIGNCYIWMLSTLGLVCASSFLIQLLSVRLYVANKSATNYLWIIHIFHLGILNRYLELFSLLWKPKNSDVLSKIARLYCEICKLRLLESFTKSALQFLVQLYIIMATGDYNLYTSVCVASSVCSLSCQLIVSNRAVHSKAQYLSWLVLTFRFFYQVGMISVRVLVMILFATVYGYWLILFIVFHWFTMIWWIDDVKIIFCDSWWEERLYKCIMGIVYCFCFISLDGNLCRKNEIIFYIFTSFQCVGLLSLCYSVSEGPANIETLIYTSILIILTGLVYIFMFCLCHPKPHGLAKSKSFENGKICLEQLTSVNNTSQKANGDLSSPGCSTISYAGPLSGTPNLLAKNIVDIVHCTSIPNNISHLHRSKSLSCTYSPQARFPMVRPIRARWVGLDYHSLPDIFNSIYAINGYTVPKSLASHFKTVNYNFRTSVAFGEQHSRFCCSCLVLCDSDSSLYDDHPCNSPSQDLLPDKRLDSLSHVASVNENPLHSTICSPNHSRKAAFKCSSSHCYNTLQLSGTNSESSFTRQYPVVQLKNCMHSFDDSNIHLVNDNKFPYPKHSEVSADCVKLGALYHSVSA